MSGALGKLTFRREAARRGGGDCDVMNSKHIRGDVNFAWPTVEIVVMRPKGAVEIIHKKEIAESDVPPCVEEALVSEYRAKFATPFAVAELSCIDDIIEPSATRSKIIRALGLLETKVDTNPKKEHGNIPL